MDKILIKQDIEIIEGYQRIENSLIYKGTLIFLNEFEEFFSMSEVCGFYSFKHGSPFEVKTCSMSGEVYLKICPLIAFTITKNKLDSIRKLRNTKEKIFCISDNGKMIVESSERCDPDYYYKHGNKWLYTGNHTREQVTWYYISLKEVKCLLLCLKALKIRLPKNLLLKSF